MKLNYNDKENRILDASMELFIKFGYDKTTVAEVAKNAGISKGAIYLHFKSKDDLFESLLFREIKTYNLKWFELIEADPKGGLLSGMYRNMLDAITSSELMIAIFKRDLKVLGSYIKKENSFFKKDSTGTMRTEFIQKMMEVGAIRKDVDPMMTAHIMDMIAFSLVSIGDVKRQEEIPPTKEVIEAIAVFMDRALTPEDGGNSEAGKQVLRDIAAATISYYEEQEKLKE